MELLKRKPLREFLKDRPTLILEEPLVRKFNLDPIGVRGIDSSLEELKRKKIDEWRSKGYSEHLISMALELADEWAYKMSEVFAPPEIREAAVRYNYPKALEVADRWIRVMGE